MPEPDNMPPPEADRYVHLFRKSVPLRVRLHEVIRALGSTEQETCLDVGSENGMLNHLLRARGGVWHSVATNREAEEAIRAVVKENVHLVEDRNLPFKKRSFDAVVVFDFLKGNELDESFIADCHRMLKPNGRLVVNVAHYKPFTPVRPLKTMLKLSEEGRRGYTESELFRILKDGFNVNNMRSYSRFFVEIVDMLIRLGARRVRAREGDGDRRLRQFYSVACFFYWMANQLDLFLFFTRGHYLICSAKRRTWRPRKAPILVDGRSISEVVLSRPAD